MEKIWMESRNIGCELCACSKRWTKHRDTNFFTTSHVWNGTYCIMITYTKILCLTSSLLLYPLWHLRRSQCLEIWEYFYQVWGITVCSVRARHHEVSVRGELRPQIINVYFVTKVPSTAYKKTKSTYQVHSFHTPTGSVPPCHICLRVTRHQPSLTNGNPTRLYKLVEHHWLRLQKKKKNQLRIKVENLKLLPIHVTVFLNWFALS